MAYNLQEVIVGLPKGTQKSTKRKQITLSLVYSRHNRGASHNIICIEPINTINVMALYLILHVQRIFTIRNIKHFKHCPKITIVKLK